MEKIPISRFKATCSEILENVRRTKKPVLITRFGKPVAEVVPPPPASKPEDWLGSLAGTARIVGDLSVPPVTKAD
jgi:prevent-host-death family protein